MRAAYYEKNGAARDVLRVAEVDTPQPGPGEVRVKLKTSGVNPSDVKAREGRTRKLSFPRVIPHSDGAGEIDAVGDGVLASRKGERVWIWNAQWKRPFGTCAEYVVLPSALASRLPAGASFEAGACLGIPAMTAYHAVAVSGATKGSTVLITGGAGGVGHYAIQFAKARGATVLATVSSEAKADLARQAGADHVTGYEEFGSVVREVTGGTGAAAVYDGVGQATFDASLAAVRPRGMMVLYGGSSGPVPPFELQRLAGSGSLFITRPTMVHYIASREELVWRAGDLFTWIREGRLSVRIGGTYPLAEAARAHDDLAARRTTGKLLLLPS